MDLPAFQFLCMEQDHSLEDHARDFLDLACLTHFLDHSCCVFYYTSLSEWCKARLPANGLKEDFSPFVEPRDQPAVPVHTPATEVELQLVSGHYYEELMDSLTAEDLIDCVGELPVTLKLPPSLPVPPPLLPASSSALSAHPQSMPSGRSDLPWHFQSMCEDPLSLPPASESWTPPRSFSPSAPPWLPPNLPVPPPLIPISSSALSARPQSMPSGRSDLPLHFQSSLRVLDSTSVLQPIGSALAPSSLVSTMARHLTSSTGLPRPVRLCLGQLSTICRLETPPLGFVLSLNPSDSVRLNLPSLQLHCGLPDSSLRLDRLSRQLCRGPSNPLCRPGSPSARLYLGIHLQWLCLHRLSSGYRLPILHHGSSHPRLP
ncbi:Histone-lysine N-methyltransferase set-2 [Labeo rohita]|uniref:Histone-lysine N-methyltransferase set-2 n=1 Tax=Labeo rohita TaxID=84645 RepID=A0ABQ8MA49_LABRO|nr:Histone-lysine N-methyltransferase set-2 [Labeo rohita]